MTTSSPTTPPPIGGIEVKTIPGKSFSVERYYMLSEVEQHALLPIYLNDHSYNELDLETVASSNTVTTVASYESSTDLDLPPFPILYLLWDCNNDNIHNDASVEEVADVFRKGPLDKAVRKLRSLSTRAASSKVGGDESEGFLQRIYVVVDVSISGGNEEQRKERDEDDENDPLRKDRFERHQNIVEALGRTIFLPFDITEDETATNTDANRVEQDTPSPSSTRYFRFSGATIGLADHPRAAPGLEACLEAIHVGARARRRRLAGKSGRSDDTDRTIQKSCVGIVCDSLQDLIGYDEETETDAVQGVLQSLTHACRFEASNSSDTSTTTESIRTSKSNDLYQSPILDYAQKAHKYWRVQKAGWPEEPTLEELQADDEASGSKIEQLIKFLAFVVLLIAYWWRNE